MASHITVDTTLYSNISGHMPRPSVHGYWAFALDTPRHSTASVVPFVTTSTYRDALKLAKGLAKHSVVVLP